MFSNAHWEQNGGQRPTLRFIGPAVRILSRYPRQAFPFLRQRLSHCLNRRAFQMLVYLSMNLWMVGCLAQCREHKLCWHNPALTQV